MARGHLPAPPHHEVTLQKEALCLELHRLATSGASETLPGLGGTRFYSGRTSSNCRKRRGGGCVISALCCLVGELLTVKAKPEALRRGGGDGTTSQKHFPGLAATSKKKKVLEKF